MEIEPKFKQTARIRRVKRFFDKKAIDEIITDPEKKFEIDFFNPLLDVSLSYLKDRFKQLNYYSTIWGFLFNIETLPKKEKLLELCLNLEKNLMSNNKSDIQGYLLCDELISFRELINKKFNDKITPKVVLNFIKTYNLQEIYQNIWISMRILLTIPVTVATGERSFLKLKLIETFFANNNDTR